jgi:hypothetical protein
MINDIMDWAVDDSSYVANFGQGTGHYMFVYERERAISTLLEIHNANWKFSFYFIFPTFFLSSYSRIEPKSITIEFGNPPNDPAISNSVGQKL